ncbi:hypothetical protein FB451DRAFT_1487026, partial [Mycena latifolia]
STITTLLASCHRTRGFIQDPRPKYSPDGFHSIPLCFMIDPTGRIAIAKRENLTGRYCKQRRHLRHPPFLGRPPQISAQHLDSGRSTVRAAKPTVKAPVQAKVLTKPKMYTLCRSRNTFLLTNNAIAAKAKALTKAPVKFMSHRVAGKLPTKAPVNSVLWLYSTFRVTLADWRVSPTFLRRRMPSIHGYDGGYVLLPLPGKTAALVDAKNLTGIFAHAIDAPATVSGGATVMCNLQICTNPPTTYGGIVQYPDALFGPAHAVFKVNSSFQVETIAPRLRRTVGAPSKFNVRPDSPSCADP